ncbi:MAG: tetratricopeptide repeat protein [Candidatus Xenobia bacterium]
MISNYQKEIADCQARIKRDPDDALNMNLLAGMYFHLAHVTNEPALYMLTEQTAQHSLDALPGDNPGAVAMLARVDEAKHYFRQALKLAESIEKSKERMAALGVEAVSYLGLGRANDARHVAQAMVKTQASSASYGYLALVDEIEGKDGDVEKDYANAFRLEQGGDGFGSGWLRCMYGRFMYRRGRIAAARGLYQEALRVFPQFPLALGLLGDLEVSQGELDAADLHYTQAYNQSPMPLYLMGKAKVARLRGNKAEAAMYTLKAEQWLRKDLATSPLGHGRELAMLLLDGGRPEDVPEAVAVMEKDVRNRRDWQTLSIYGQALEAAGRWPEADKVLQEALKPGLRDADTLYFAGCAAAKLGRTDDARRDFEAALSADPVFDHADDARKRGG